MRSPLEIYARELAESRFMAHSGYNNWKDEPERARDDRFANFLNGARAEVYWADFLGLAMPIFEHIEGRPDLWDHVHKRWIEVKWRAEEWQDVYIQKSVGPYWRGWPVWILASWGPNFEMKAFVRYSEEVIERTTPDNGCRVLAAEDLRNG